MKANIQTKGILYERLPIIASLVKQKTILLIFSVIILVCGIHGISYAQLPSFSDTTASRSVAENSPTGTNIGDPVTANNFSGGTDRYRLADTDDNADSPDSDSFGIGSATGQLTTNTALDFETKKAYQVVIIVERSQGETWVEATNSSRITVTINVTNVFDVPLSERTEQVADEIVAQSPVSTADAVTEAHLSKIKWLLINNEGISSLKEKDFDGLSSLSAIWLNRNDLTSLPDNIFSGLSKLDTILLSHNPLGSLDKDVFSGLSKLKTLRLENIRLTSLPGSIFNGLSKLEEIHLNDNQLSSLPDDLFSGLTKLKSLYMNGNTVNPLPLTISLAKAAEGQFKAVAPTGAPFAMVLPLVITNGSTDGSTTSVRIPQGSVESNTLTVTRTSGTTAAVTVDIGSSLPSLPALHQGYAITKSTELPLTVIDATETSFPVFNTGLNTTPEVAENAAANITSAHL